MTVEIAVAPERAMAVLARYGLTVDGKRALDAYYRERVTGSAEVQAAWNRAYQAYHAWLKWAGQP